METVVRLQFIDTVSTYTFILLWLMLRPQESKSKLDSKTASFPKAMFSPMVRTLSKATQSSKIDLIYFHQRQSPIFSDPVKISRKSFPICVSITKV